MSDPLEIFLRPAANITPVQKTKCAVFLMKINNMQMTDTNIRRMLAILTELEIHNPEQYRSYVYSALTSTNRLQSHRTHPVEPYSIEQYGTEAHMYWTQ